MRKLVLVITACFLSATMLTAQGFATKGCMEIGGDIGYSSYTPVVNDETGDASSTLQFSSFTGYFIMDGLEIGFAPLSYSVYTPAKGDNTTDLSILFAPSYNFNLRSKLFPFIEALVGYTARSYGDNTYSGLSWGGRAGLKFILGPNALINSGIQYMNYTYNPEGSDKRNGSNLLMINAGFAIYFSSKK